MGYTGQTHRIGSQWSILLAVVCLLLVVVAGTVQVAHTHAGSAVNHADCSLCVAAHATVQVATSAAPGAAVAVLAALESAFQPTLPAALSTFALFTRPPPVDVVAS